MRRHILLCIVFICFGTLSFGQTSLDTLQQDDSRENILSATTKAKALHVDLENEQEVELLLKKIHTYKYLESIVLEGEAEEATLKKIIYRLSSLKNFNHLSLKDNFLQKAPDNLNTLKSLHSLSITGNKDLNYNDFFSKINSLPLHTLELTDNDFKTVSVQLSTLKQLKKIKVSGSDQLDYELLMDELAKLPVLTSLAIPVNFITEVPKNIVKLKALQVLDVSDNVLTEIPEDVSALKSINNLSIQGNLFLNPVKELEKFKGADIRVISMDKEISGDEIEEIKKIFPNVEINFPLNTNDEEEPEPGPITVKENEPFEQKNTGTLKAKKEFKILSEAYLFYPGIFQNIMYTFDTLGFNQRYADANYTNVYRRLLNNPPAGTIVRLGISRFKLWRGEKKRFRFTTFRTLYPNYPELNAFAGMDWVYQGDMNKKKFKKKIVKQTWLDVRIIYDNNNSQFSIQLKSEKGFENIKAYPIPPLFGQLEQVQKTYPRRYSNYQKTLTRRAERFNKDLRKNKKKYDADYKKIEDFAWAELQSRMSNEEKLMDREEWLEYYDNIIANEKQALNKSSLSPVYLNRSLVIRNYTTAASDLNAGRVKTTNIQFIDKNTGATLPVASVFVIDNKNKTYYTQSGSLGLNPEPIWIKQFSSNVIIVVLRNGRIGVVSSADIDKLPPVSEETLTLKAVIFNKNLDEIGACLKEASIE